MEWLVLLVATAVSALAALIALAAIRPDVKRFLFRIRERGDLNQFRWVGDDVSFLSGHLHLTKPGPQNLVDHLRWMRESTDGAHLFWAGPLWPVLSLCSPETVQPVLKSAAPKSYPYRKILPWLGVSLLTSAGDTWKRKRRMITPAFHYTILQGFQPVFCDKTRLMLERFEAVAQSGQPIDVFRMITLCTLDIIGMCAFGTEIDALNNPNSPYVLATYELSELFYNRLFDPLLLVLPDFLFERITATGRRWRAALDIIHDLPDKVIAARRAALQSGVDTGISVVSHEREYVDFLHILLTSHDGDNNALPSQEVRDEVDTFMFEGHDTTSSGLTWALYCIATHPEVEAKVIAEVDAVLGDNEHVDFEDLRSFPYLDCVIKETLRVYPPVPGIGRLLDTDVIINGKRVPAGTEINIMPYVLHRNPKAWTDPEKFDPDRWLHVGADGIDDKKHPYAYIPFSAGPRNCVGQHFAMNEERTILAMIYKRFRLRVHGPAPEVEPHIVLRPKGGMFMTIERR